MKIGRRFGKALFLVAIVTFFICSTAHAQVPGQVPDLSIWVNTWFKVTQSRTVYHFSNIGVKPTPATPVSQSGGTSYLKITGWDTTTPGAEFLTADVYARDLDTGQWDPIPAAELNINYFAGSNLKFVGLVERPDPTGVTLNLMFVFTGKRNKADTNFIMDGTTKLSTMGGHVYEIDDVPLSTERWAGAGKIGGPMVLESKVPAAIR